ncbi:MAG: MBL fold metallo-hydrolase [Candidatus Nanopelagicales bacterium]|nr:MBL fold metallo-hydrolase [Actinomycetota bacterium]
MLIAGFPAGPWGTNCFVVATGPGQECIVIDPGKDAMPGVDEVVRENRLQPVAVLVTHGHLDHMWSVTPVCEARDVPAYIHPADRHLLADPMAGISGDTRVMFEQMTGGRLQFSEPDDVRELTDQTDVELAGLRFGVRHAPGHTPGSTVFITDADGDVPPIMYSGDLLFAGSIGRTDLPGGDTDAMMRSLAQVVLPQPEEMIVLPGHGEQTSIGRELAGNPFLAQARDHHLEQPPGRGL